MGRLSEGLSKLGIRSRQSSKSPEPLSKAPGPIEPATKEPSNVRAPTSPTTASNGLWARAWERFASEYPDEAKDFQHFIATSSQMQGEKDGQKIAKSITDAYDKYQSEHEVSQKVKDTFHKILSTVQKGSQFIGFAVSFNPIAASVWTGVSLVIPILLMPGNQSEAATETLKECIELLQCYQSYERLLQDEDCDSVRIACDKIVSLYLTVLQFEAKLARHRDQGGAKRLMDSLKNDWSDTSKRLKAIDTEFKSRMDAVRDIWTQRERRRREDAERSRQSNKTIAALYIDVEPPKASRIPGTCEWFLRRPEFLAWRIQSSGLLWVTADPGCGKSVLVKYLVENRNELLKEPDDRLVVASFYFSGGHSFSNSTTAICSLMNQILAAAPEYSKLVDHFCEKKGMEPRDLRTSSTSKVWSLLCTVTQAVAAKHQIICVLDALDECEPESLETLLEALDELSAGKSTAIPSLRFLITSRPYEELLRGLRRTIKITPDVRIDAAEEQEVIRDEISVVINERVKDLSEDKALNKANQQKLLSALQSAEHKTYLWLYLVLERFKTEWVHAGQDISNFVNTMPDSVEEEYSSILSRMKDVHLPDARKVFQIMLAALEPLTAAAVYEALRMTKSVTSIEDLKPGVARPVAEIIRDICGLFIIVDQKDRLYFLHQTARDYLLETADGPVRDSPSRRSRGTRALKWHHEFTISTCHIVLAESCLRYITLPEFQSMQTMAAFLDFDARNLSDSIIEYHFGREDGFGFIYEHGYEWWETRPSLLPYSANFLYHLKLAGEEVPEEVCQLVSGLASQDYRYHLTFSGGELIQAGFGHECSMIKICAALELIPYLAYKRQCGADLYTISEKEVYDKYSVYLSYEEEYVGLTIPLNEAIVHNRRDSVTFLLELESLPADHIIFQELRKFNVRHPLRLAALSGPDMLKLVNSRSEFRASLAHANDSLGLLATDGSRTVESLELLYGVESTYFLGYRLSEKESLLLHSLLSFLWDSPPEQRQQVYEMIVKVTPTSVNDMEQSGISPLCFSIHYEDSWLRDKLLEDGASWTTRSEIGRNILHGCALTRKEITRIFGSLDTIPSVQLQGLLNSPDDQGVTPLLFAIQKYRSHFAMLLLDVPGIQVNLASSDGETPLQAAKKNVETPLRAARGNRSEWEDVVRRLVEMGAS